MMADQHDKQHLSKKIDFLKDGNFYIKVQLKAEELSEVVISSRKKEIFLLKKKGRLL